MPPPCLTSCPILPATPNSYSQVSQLLPHWLVGNNGPVFPLLATLTCGRGASTGHTPQPCVAARYVVTHTRSHPELSKASRHPSATETHAQPKLLTLRSVSRGTARGRTPQPSGLVAFGCQTYFSFLPPF